MSGRSIAYKIWENFYNSIKPRQLWGTFVGEDLNGTKYYEIQRRSSAARRPSRWFEPRDRDNFQQDIPAEWEAWLRCRRRDPPTLEEIVASVERQKAVRRNAEEINKKYLQQEIKSVESVASADKVRFPTYDDLEQTPGSMSRGK